MKLPELLSNAAAACIILGAGGLAGAVEFGAGYITSTALLLIGVLLAIWATKEDGSYYRNRSYSTNHTHNTHNAHNSGIANLIRRQNASQSKKH